MWHQSCMTAVPSDQSRSPRKTGPRRPINRPSALTQAYDMRDIAAKLCLEMANTPATTISDLRARAQAVRDYNTVWDNCCERALVIKGHGRPKSVPAKNDPDAKRVKRRPMDVEPSEKVVELQRD